jgi:hypothetical protein
MPGSYIYIRVVIQNLNYWDLIIYDHDSQLLKKKKCQITAQKTAGSFLVTS